MQPFIKSPTILALTGTSTNDPPPTNTDNSQSIEDELEALDKTMQHLDFQYPRVKGKVDEIS